MITVYNCFKEWPTCYEYTDCIIYVCKQINAHIIIKYSDIREDSLVLMKLVQKDAGCSNNITEFLEAELFR